MPGTVRDKPHGAIAAESCAVTRPAGTLPDVTITLGRLLFLAVLTAVGVLAVAVTLLRGEQEVSALPIVEEAVTSSYDATLILPPGIGV